MGAYVYSRPPGKRHTGRPAGQQRAGTSRTARLVVRDIWPSRMAKCDDILPPGSSIPLAGHGRRLPNTAIRGGLSRPGRVAADTTGTTHRGVASLPPGAELSVAIATRGADFSAQALHGSRGSRGSRRGQHQSRPARISVRPGGAFPPGQPATTSVVLPRECCPGGSSGDSPGVHLAPGSGIVNTTKPECPFRDRRMGRSDVCGGRRDAQVHSGGLHPKVTRGIRPDVACDLPKRRFSAGPEVPARG